MSILYQGDNPQNWVDLGVDLGAKIGGVNTSIVMYNGTDASQEIYTALDGDGSDINSTSGNVNTVVKVEELIDENALSGIGVGKETAKPTNRTSNANAEIQSSAGVGVADQLFVDFNRETDRVVVEFNLFYSQEVVPWSPGVAAEQFSYQILKEVPTGGDTVIGARKYDIVDGFITQPAVGTGTFSDENPGRYYHTINSTDVFDAIILQGADYSVPSSSDPNYVQGTPTTDTSDYLLSSIQLDPITPLDPSGDEKECFGGDDNPNSWGNVEFAYSILEGSDDLVTDNDNTYDEDSIDPIQDSSDLGAITNLPTNVDGLGVGDPNGTNTNDPVPTNPEIQGNPAQIEKNDALRIDFNQSANIAEITLSLFYAKEYPDNNGIYYPEQMKYQLLKQNGSTYDAVGGEVLVTAVGTGTYSSSNPGLYTFTVDSAQDFDTILFLGANYGTGSNGSSAPSTANDVSDYLVRKVCLTYKGDGGDTLTATSSADTFEYYSIYDGGDTINSFNPSQDAIVIDKSGFGLTLDSDFDAILGQTSLGNATVSQYFQYSGGVLYFDPDGTTPNTDRVALATLTGSPSLTSLYFQS